MISSKEIISKLDKIIPDPKCELIYNKDELKAYIENIEAQLPDQLEQSSYYLEDDSLKRCHSNCCYIGNMRNWSSMGLY